MDLMVVTLSVVAFDAFVDVVIALMMVVVRILMVITVLVVKVLMC